MKIRRGMPVMVEFLDHSQDLGKLVPCRVWGKCVRANAESIEIHGWEITDPKIARAIGPENLTRFNILRQALTAAYRVAELEKLEL